METISPYKDNYSLSEFKSYYVVWKPKNPKIVEKILKSLNRTMQYGNTNENNSTKNSTKSLNRTMQYGN